jgi:hypothetical protein
MLARTRRGVAPQARRPGLGALLVAVTAVSLLAGCAASGSSTTHFAKPARGDSASYGSLPSFLPRQSFDTDRILNGTAANPALTSEGDAVSIGTGSSAGRITVTGPEVPGEGLPSQQPATTCTWTVTIHAGSHPIHVSAVDFSAIDHLGAIYSPALVAGQPNPPKVLAAHASISFELRAVMVVGEGLMRWAPDGKHVVAKWDFEVEND